jgi:hypothetical protein
MPTVYSPPVSTYVPLATYEITSGTDTEIIFSSIPATYRDVIIEGVVRSDRAATDDDLFIQFNSDTGSNYSYVRMIGRSAGTNSATNINGTSTNDLGAIPAASSTSGQFGSVYCQVMDYSATDKHKTSLTRTSSAGSTDVVGAHAGRWAVTDAVTTIKVYPRVGAFVVGTTLSLYGIAS